MPRRLLNLLYAAGMIVAAASLCLICLLIVAQIVGRWFGMIIPSAEDFTGFLLVSTLFYGLAYSFRHNSHIRVLFVIDRAKKHRLKVEFLSLSVLLALVGYLTYSLALFTYETYVFHEVSTGYIPVPLWIPQTSMVAGSALFLLAVAEDWLRCIRSAKPSYMIAQEQGEHSTE